MLLYVFCTAAHARGFVMLHLYLVHWYTMYMWMLHF